MSKIVIKPSLALEVLGSLAAVDKAKYDTFDEVLKIGKASRKLRESFLILFDEGQELNKKKLAIDEKYRKLWSKEIKNMEDGPDKQKAELDLTVKRDNEYEESNIMTLIKEYNEALSTETEVELDKDSIGSIKKALGDNFKALGISPEILEGIINILDNAQEGKAK